MKNKHSFLAFDLGATSGRSILATIKNGTIECRELTRFPNKIIQVHDKYYWNIFSLYEELKNGLKAATAQNVQIDAIGIDTWGVDFVYLDENGAILSLPRSYRDPYTNGIPEKYFESLSSKDLYGLTGIQIMNFNSLFQLYAAKEENPSLFATAKEILFMPDALAYMLTGKKVCEYTIASTSQLLNQKTKQVENRLLEIIGISPSVVNPIRMPGQTVGYLTKAVVEECGHDKVPVISVAGHDTASAIVAIPAENENFAYLSSGTWSLMGIELKEPIVDERSYQMNFTNEGGVDGTTRFLKNITGMWLLERCIKEWESVGNKYSYSEIMDRASSSPSSQSIIDPDDSSFANPESMITAISVYCKNSNQKIPVTVAEIARCIFDSLALKYKQVLSYLREVAPFEIEKLHVIGGGAQNDLLNQLTANAIGIPVVAGPSEATAIGNVMMQAKGIGILGSLQEIRKVVRDSVTPKTFYPEDINQIK